MYPYTIYNMETTGNLAEQFKSLGYSTTAMHPNHATNWNRENVYKDFGFDQFLSINDFQGADTLRGMVTDQATYDKILELLDQNADPQFIFDVTMQNHSGYDTGLLPVDKQLHLNIDTTDLDTKTVEDGTLSDVDEYVSCIEQSDQALRYFLNALSKLDRKVVVVFWGDHQPFFRPSSTISGLPTRTTPRTRSACGRPITSFGPTTTLPAATRRARSTTCPPTTCLPS